MNLIDKDTNKDAIIAYLKSPETGIDHFTAKQKQLLDYYVDAYTLIRNYSSIPDTINVLIKLSIHRGERISTSTARRYIHDAQDVFGYSSKTKPEAIQHLAMEIIRDAIGMARDQNNPDVMIKGAKELMAIGGKEIEQPFNPEMLEQHIIEIGLDKPATDTLQLITTKGVVDLDTLMGNAMNSMAVDAEIINDDQHTDR
ncbi:hypothetical protein [Mucilaginibacter sp.]|uniref:hypothetical protein n=1 Tax=Mucilaginibacter sp. TaxID=1882438 RepID=UPI0035BC7543